MRAILAEPDNELYSSAASSWEMANKWPRGELRLPMPPQDHVPQRMEQQAVAGLPVQHRHALHSAGLPRHHRDPFDRLLIAPAQREKLTLMTADRKLAAYAGIDLLWA